LPRVLRVRDDVIACARGTCRDRRRMRARRPPRSACSHRSRRDAPRRDRRRPAALARRARGHVHARKAHRPAIGIMQSCDAGRV